MRDSSEFRPYCCQPPPKSDHLPVPLVPKVCFIVFSLFFSMLLMHSRCLIICLTSNIKNWDIKGSNLLYTILQNILARSICRNQNNVTFNELFLFFFFAIFVTFALEIFWLLCIYIHFSTIILRPRWPRRASITSLRYKLSKEW